jgi:hypothetical protein
MLALAWATLRGAASHDLARSDSPPPSDWCGSQHPAPTWPGDTTSATSSSSSAAPYSCRPSCRGPDGSSAKFPGKRRKDQDSYESWSIT